MQYRYHETLSDKVYEITSGCEVPEGYEEDRRVNGLPARRPRMLAGLRLHDRADSQDGKHKFATARASQAAGAH